MNKERRRRFVRSFTKKNQKVLMKIDEMVDIFLNSAIFASHAFLTLAPPSGYALNLKALIKVSKVSWTSQLSYKILRSSLERKFDETNFMSQKCTPSKSPGLLGLTLKLSQNKKSQTFVTMLRFWMLFLQKAADQNKNNGTSQGYRDRYDIFHRPSGRWLFWLGL